MSAVIRRTVEVRRYEYAVPSGCAGADLLDAINMALGEMPDDRRGFDDAYRVEARDEEIVVVWTEEGPS